VLANQRLLFSTDLIPDVISNDYSKTLTAKNCQNIQLGSTKPNSTPHAFLCVAEGTAHDLQSNEATTTLLFNIQKDSDDL
jgi:hypothetical protein